MVIEQRAVPSKRSKPAPELLVGSLTTLRPIGRSDLPTLQAWDEDPEIVALMGRRFADRSADEWYRSVSAGYTCRALAIETMEGKLVGELELAQLNWRMGTTELRICLGEKEYWGRGFGGDAFRTALRLAFEGYRMRQVYLRVFMTNVRALHLYERTGFRREALLEPSTRRGDPASVLLMNLTRERWTRLQERAVRSCVG